MLIFSIMQIGIAAVSGVFYSTGFDPNSTDAALLVLIASSALALGALSTELVHRWHDRASRNQPRRFGRTRNARHTSTLDKADDAYRMKISPASPIMSFSDRHPVVPKASNWNNSPPQAFSQFSEEDEI